MRSKLRRYYLEGLTGDILSNLEKIKKQRYIHNSLLASYYYYTGQPKKSLALLGNNQQDDKSKSYNERRRLARISYYAGNPEKALYIYKDLYESETNQRRKERLLFDMGELNLELSNFKTAEIYFKNYLASYPWSRKAREVHWLLPWTLYLGGKHQEAYDGFLSLADKIKKRPNRYRRIDDKQVYYWAARALQKSGQEKRAALIYQQISGDPLVSYYAILSSLRLEELASKNQVLLSSKDFLKIPWIDKSKRVIGLKERFLESFKLSSRMPSALHVGNNSYGVPIVDLDESYPKKKVKIKPVEESTYSDYLMRYTYFSRLGFWSDASEELVLVKRLAKTKELKKKLLNYFESTEDYSNSSRLASMSFYRERHYSKPEVAFEYWSKAYPKAYEEHVDGASALFGVSKNLIWGIMRAESFFDTKIMSPVGARGLLQVMPYTGAKILSILSGRDPLSDVITSDHQLHISKSLLEAKTNIRYGAKYMSRLSKQFDGHLPFVAAGYNGGPHRVKMWSKIMGDVAQDEFTERIPFNETRKYVKKVMRNMYVYSSLYDEPMDMSYLIKPTAYVEKGPIPTSEYWGKL
jgi:soluble lytic murein transglycosylase